MRLPFDRLSALRGALVGVLAGAALGVAAGRASTMAEPPTVGLASASAAPTPPAVVSGVPSAAPSLRAPSDTGWPRISYAQQGEDLIVRNVFDALQVTSPSYIDIGAYHPFINNNTYLFYRAGSRGVLVEPNPAFTEMLRVGRPGDTVLPIGIGINDEAEADYYVIHGSGQDNTFSKEQADALVKLHGPQALERVIKIPLRGINSVLDETFPSGGPDFFSIDIEGMDLAVLQTLNFERHRPKVFCIEMHAVGVDKEDVGIAALMKAKGYAPGGGNFVNTIFVDAKLASKR
jgi:FkbM family methyltransferase